MILLNFWKYAIFLFVDVALRVASILENIDFIANNNNRQMSRSFVIRLHPSYTFYQLVIPIQNMCEGCTRRNVINQTNGVYIPQKTIGK